MRTLEYILIIFSIIFLGSFFWTSSCFGVYEEPFWFESFEDFPFNAINLKLYSGYTENPYDAFYISYDEETDWQSYIYNSTNGNYSIKIEYWGLDWPTDFNWVSGFPILEEEVETGGELFFDYYFSEDFSCPDVGFSFAYEDPEDVMHGGYTPYSYTTIPNTYFNSGEWNNVQLEWYWNWNGYFIYDFYLNGVGIGSIFESASQGDISSFMMGFEGCLVPSGYALVDNFRMYDSIDVVDPEEEPPETYDFLAWTDYYTSISEKFATSTPLFNNIAGSLTPIINKMGDFILFIEEYFDVGEAVTKGQSLGLAIPKARGYLVIIDDFISLPLSGFIIFFLLTMAVVVCYKVILAIIKLLKP